MPRLGGIHLIYEVIVGTGTETKEYINLSYEGVLNVMIDHLLSGEQAPISIRRRCCSSIHKQTMTIETCNKIRELVGSSKENDQNDIRKKMDVAINNWYLRGKLSLSEEDIIGPSDVCQLR